ncbi:MAG: SHOCT domain-containing protein [Candidatus Dormibacteria bacterium]
MDGATVGQLSDDCLWAWDGKRWIRVQKVSIGCGRCGSVVAIEQGKKDFKCPVGHRQDLIACKQCRGAFQRPTEHRQYDIRCIHCGYSSLYVSTLTAWEWVSEWSARGLSPTASMVGADPDRRVLHDFTLAASGGSRIPNGSRCVVDCGADGVRISAAAIEEIIPYADIHALQITGSTTRSSAGVFGGGFGVVGAVEGMLAASVINSLTSSTKVFSLVRIAARSAEYVCVSNTVDSGSLNMLMTPVQLRIRQAQATPPGATSSVADELTKLAELRDRGVLSETEFAAAKTRLLS